MEQAKARVRRRLLEQLASSTSWADRDVEVDGDTLIAAVDGQRWRIAVGLLPLEPEPPRPAVRFVGHPAGVPAPVGGGELPAPRPGSGVVGFVSLADDAAGVTWVHEWALADDGVTACYTGSTREGERG